MPTTISQTEQKIIQQLKQKTGRALCDSGGTPQYDKEGNYIGSKQGYGRAWERDAKREFADEPFGTYEIYAPDEIIPYISTYHFLTERAGLHYDLQKDLRLQKFMEENDLWGMSGMDSFVEGLSQYNDITGVYGDGDYMLINTYNSECVLDRTLQFIYFEWNGWPHVTLQTHNGCDVRGGYSTPVLYELPDFDGERILFFADASIYAGERNWYTDDGWNWYEDGSTAGTDLKDMEFDDEARDHLEKDELVVLSSEDPDTVYIWETDEAYIGGELLTI